MSDNINKFDREIWQKALILDTKLRQDGEMLGRNRLMKYLNTSEKLAEHIAFILKNRDIINCSNIIYPTKAKDIELCFGDLHIPFQDRGALSVMFEYADLFHPNIVTIMGDLLDCYQISTFLKNPIRGKRLFEEIQEGKEFLYEVRDRYPEAKIILYRGNHEERIERYICDKAPQLAELVESLLPEKLELNKLNIEYITEPFVIGKLWHLHGSERTGGGYNPEHILNVLIQYVEDHFVTFHYHRSQSKTFKRIGNRYWNTNSVGYLATDLDYAKMNKWQQGFGIVEYEEDGSFTFHNKTILNGSIY